VKRLALLLLCLPLIAAIPPAVKFIQRSAATASTPTATLVWVYSTTRTDGTAVTGSLTTNIYVGPTGAEVLQPGLTTSGTTATITGAWGGTTQCFKVSETETGGGTSSLTNEVCKTFPLAAPNPQTSLTVS
jgi:hypothetical protein